MNYQGFSSRMLLAMLMLALGLTQPAQTQAQQQRPTAQTPGWSAAEIIAQFEADGRGYTSGEGTFRVMYVFRNPDLFPRVRRDSILSSLERLALESDHGRTRIAAVTLLSTVGARAAVMSETNVPQRMERIYRQTSEDVIQDHVLGMVSGLADQETTIAFLRGVARQPPEPQPRLIDPEDDAAAAIYALARMGERGRAALRELHRSGAVRSPRARAQLQRLAEHDFPVTDERAARERLEREHDSSPHR